MEAVSGTAGFVFFVFRKSDVQVYLWQLSSLDVKLLVDVRALAAMEIFHPNIQKRRRKEKTNMTCTWGNCVDFKLMLFYLIWCSLFLYVFNMFEDS